MHSQSRQCADNLVQRYCVQLGTLESLPQLSLVRLVDKVVSGLDADAVGLYGLIRTGSDLLESLKTLPQDCVFDAEGKCISVFEAAEVYLLDWNGRYTLRRQDAFNDPKLNSNLEDEVVMAYDSVLAAQKELLSVLDTVKWYILEHNADIEADGEVYDSVEDLIASLND